MISLNSGKDAAFVIFFLLVAGIIATVVQIFVIDPISSPASYAAMTASASSVAVKGAAAAFFASSTGIGLLVVLGICTLAAIYSGAKQAIENPGKGIYQIVKESILGSNEPLSAFRVIKQLGSVVFFLGIGLGAGFVQLYNAGAKAWNNTNKPSINESSVCITSTSSSTMVSGLSVTASKIQDSKISTNMDNFKSIHLPDSKSNSVANNNLVQSAEMIVCTPGTPM